MALIKISTVQPSKMFPTSHTSAIPILHGPIVGVMVVVGIVIVAVSIE